MQTFWQYDIFPMPPVLSTSEQKGYRLCLSFFVSMLHTKTPKKTDKKKRGIANPQYKSKIKLRTTGTAAEVCCVCFRHLNCD